MSNLVPLLVAALCGGLLGLERESEGKAAGLRTHLLVGLGAALATQLSLAVSDFGVRGFADPARIAAQIVSGIGFIGAGVILQSRGSVRGLTTAATLWVAAMIGMAAGMEAYLQAGFVTVIALLALRGLSHLDAHFRRQPQWHVLEVTWLGTPEDPEEFLRRIAPEGLPLRSMEGAFVRGDESGCRVGVRARSAEIPAIVLALGRSPDVKEVRTL